MASFSLSPSLHRINPIHPRKPAQRIKLAAVLPCRSHLSPPPENKESKGKEIHLRRTASMIYSKVEKLARELREVLSPKQKGDWKDVALMSFSFAVYIYISQRIVCAYCAWISAIDKQF